MFDERNWTKEERKKEKRTKFPTRSLFIAMQSTLLLPAGDDDDLLGSQWMNERMRVERKNEEVVKNRHVS
jgi:hypothetical protein